MAVYRYIATPPDTNVSNRRSAVVRGELTADSAYQVRLALRRMGLLPRRVTELTRRDRSSGAGARGRLAHALERVASSRKRTRLVELYENLAALLATGTQIAEGKLYYFFLKPEKIQAWHEQMIEAKGVPVER